MYVGGPIAALEDSDVVTIDVAERELSVDLSEAEIQARLDEREASERSYRGGVLAKYQRDFGSAANGAVTNPKAQWE